jgi:hypothetical protein
MISLERSEKRNHKQREKTRQSAQRKAQKPNRISHLRQVFLLDTLNLTFKG